MKMSSACIEGYEKARERDLGFADKYISHVTIGDTLQIESLRKELLSSKKERSKSTQSSPQRWIVTTI